MMSMMMVLVLLLLLLLVLMWKTTRKMKVLQSEGLKINVWFQISCILIATGVQPCPNIAGTHSKMK
jgi:hypothetical protein